jgi:hypothetical protein
VPEGSPHHHAPTQIQTLAHRPVASGGHQINGTINVTNPDNVARGVTTFQGYGLGVYCCVSTNSGVVSANALTSPKPITR